MKSKKSLFNCLKIITNKQQTQVTIKMDSFKFTGNDVHFKASVPMDLEYEGNQVFNTILNRNDILDAGVNYHPNNTNFIISFKCQEDKNKVSNNGSITTLICDYTEQTGHAHLRKYSVIPNTQEYVTPTMTRIPDTIMIANWNFKAPTRRNDLFKKEVFKCVGFVSAFNSSKIFKNVQTIQYNNDIDLNDLHSNKQNHTIQIYEAFETDAIILRFNNWPAIMYKYGLQALQALHKNGQWTWIMTNKADADPLFIIQAATRADYNQLIYELESGHISYLLEEEEDSIEDKKYKQFNYEKILNWKFINTYIKRKNLF